MLSKKIIKHILLISWCILIFVFSGEVSVDSNSRSLGITEKVVEIYERVFDKTLDEEKRVEIIDNLNYIVRKLAHFTIYLVLGVLAYSCFLEYNLSVSKTIVFTIIFCLFYAISDEVHQLFISGRSGRVFDVFIDSFGSITGTFVYYLLKVLKK